MQNRAKDTNKRGQMQTCSRFVARAQPQRAKSRVRKHGCRREDAEPEQLRRSRRRSKTGTGRIRIADAAVSAAAAEHSADKKRTDPECLGPVRLGAGDAPCGLIACRSPRAPPSCDPFRPKGLCPLRSLRSFCGRLPAPSRCGVRPSSRACRRSALRRALAAPAVPRG